MKKLMISILLFNLLAACAGEKPKEPVVESQPTPVPVAVAPKPAELSAVATTVVDSTPVAPSVADSAPAAAAISLAADPLNDPNSILAKRSAHYPFDVSVVQDADKPVLEAHAKYLREHASLKVRLEGNCDERGSAEYNLALGQRRADAVKKFLLAAGVNSNQIDTVSYGEERPKLACHEEKCWKENRRTDLNYNAQ